MSPRSRPTSTRSGRGAVGAALAVVLTAAVVLASAPTVGASTFPPLPEPGRAFLSNLSADSVAPGASSELRYEVTNPTNATISAAVATFGVYAFNGLPGDAVTPVPVANAPNLVNATSTALAVNVSLGALAANASVRGSVGIVTGANTPAGTFAIRTALEFTEGGKLYRLESRGWFSAAAWANATTEPNGSGTVNLTRLNISAVLPETAVLVDPNDWPLVLGVLLGLGLVLVGLGAYVYFRRTSANGSRSGAG